MNISTTFCNIYVGRDVFGEDEAREFRELREGWRAKTCMWNDRQTVVHNDVTPANILFGDGPWVIAIDLERMKLADRVLDLGRVVGELQYYFLRHAGDRWLAEPFIGHFLWEYAAIFPTVMPPSAQSPAVFLFMPVSLSCASHATYGLPIITAGN